MTFDDPLPKIERYRIDVATGCFALWHLIEKDRWTYDRIRMKTEDSK